MADVAEDLNAVCRRLINLIEGDSSETDKHLAWCAGRVAEGLDEIERLRAENADLRKEKCKCIDAIAPHCPVHGDVINA